MTDMQPVTVMGLGMMGSAVAGAFLRHGHPTTIWNRSSAKADRLVEQGATRSTSVTEAVSASPTVVICVWNDEAVREILEPAASALPERRLINLTSGTPDQARGMATWAEIHGAEYLAGAIMAVPPAIGGAQALVLYSGSEHLFKADRPTLTSLGRDTYLGPDPGTASLYDLALLGIMWSTLSGFYHAAALVGTEGVEASTFAPVAADWMSAVTGFLPDDAREIDVGNYATEISALGLNAAGIGHLVEASKAQGIGVDVPGPLKALFDRGVAEGRGAQSLASLVELIRTRVSS